MNQPPVQPPMPRAGVVSVAASVAKARVLAYYLHHFSPYIIEFKEGVGLHWYGFSYVLGFLLGYWLYLWLARRGYTDMPPELVSDFITWAALFGVMVGGRLGWIIFYGWRDVLENPLSALTVWKGGMASHGGILGLVFFTLYFSRRHKLSWTSIGDSLVVVAPIGLFLVRCANFINGELYGKPTDVRWAWQFPSELRSQFSEEAIRALSDEQLRSLLPPRHPSQIYEALLEGVVLFLLLWVMRIRFRVPRGVLTGTFFIAYALLRILGEVFREPDPAWHMGPFSAGQFLSLFFFLIGAAFIVWGCKAKQYERALSPAKP